MTRRLKIGSILAVLLLAANVPNDQTVDFNGEVNETLRVNVTKQLNDSLVETHQLVTINSPGGSVAELHLILDQLAETDYDTYVKTFAASAAADTLMSTKGTIFADPDAVILLHGARVIGPLGNHITAPMVADMIKNMEQNPASNPDEIKYLKDLFKMLDTINMALFKRVMDRHPNVDKEMAFKKVFGEMRDDIFFTATELKALGFDISLEKPKKSDYNSVRIYEIVLETLKKLFM